MLAPNTTKAKTAAGNLLRAKGYSMAKPIRQIKVPQSAKLLPGDAQDTKERVLSDLHAGRVWGTDAAMRILCLPKEKKRGR